MDTLDLITGLFSIIAVIASLLNPINPGDRDSDA
jgi:hypothetical protein